MSPTAQQSVRPGQKSLLAHMKVFIEPSNVMQAMRLGEARGLYEYEVNRYIAIKNNMSLKYTIL